MNYRKPAFWVIVAAVVACVVVAVCFLTSPSKQYKLPWDQFCFSENGGTSQECKLELSEKKYVTKILNDGEWENGDINPGTDEYPFYFQKQLSY